MWAWGLLPGVPKAIFLGALSILPSASTHIYTWHLIRGYSPSQAAEWEQNADLKHSGTFYYCPLPLSPSVGANTALSPAFFRQHILPKPTPEWKVRVFYVFPNYPRSTMLLTHLRPERSDSKGRGKHLKCISITGKNKYKLVSHSISLLQIFALHPSFPSTQKNISD